MHLIGHAEKGRDRGVINHGSFRIPLAWNSVRLERMLPEQGLTAYVHSASPVERGLQYRLAFVRLN
jgi:hypothetical protein